MKFNVMRSRFLDLLSNVQSVVPSKPALQIISNAMVEVKENVLTLTATDLDVSVRTLLSTDLKVDEEGKTTLPVRKIIEILRMAPEGEIQIEVDVDNVARIITPAAKYKVMGLDVHEFPVIKEPNEDAKCFTVDRALFREMLRKTSYAAGTDETRRILTGVLMQFAEGKLTMVATDGKRLALVEQELEFAADSACEMIVPPKAVTELMRLLAGEGQMKIFVQANQMVIDCGTFRFYSKLIEGVYAKYRQVIPSSCDERVTISREELIASIQRVAIMSNDKAYAVKLAFNEGAVTLSAASTEAGEASDVLPIKYSGRAINATYNPAYIMDCLRTLDTDEIIFELSDGHAPAVIKCGIPFLYVIMPLRIPM
ncbi:MAG: DNA polymerase III subunit beta [Kiritimatiellia bacterium]